MTEESNTTPRSNKRFPLFSAASPSKPASRLLWIILLSSFTFYILTAIWFYERQKTYKRALSEVRKNIRNLDDHPAIIGIKHRISDNETRLQNELASAQTRQKTLEDSFEKTRELINRDQTGWIITEVEYLLRLAQVRLNLAYDAPSAREALKIADQRLASLANPRFLPVREILATEINALNEMQNPAVDEISSNLLAANQLLNTLSPDAYSFVTAPIAANQNPNWFERLLNALGFHRFSAFPDKLSLQQVFYLKEQLRLELDGARFALYRLDKENFTMHLQTCLNLLNAHYDQKNAVIAQLITQLDTLLTKSTFPAPPNISGSLQKLRQITHPSPAAL
ncbi:MAG: uroporphyrinogen-III C-methyltransferase [Gammaproteobacteria bacterium]|nr:uroporphyrinogen-III C-methyltransferase [Gammaproteobacteria bacterium]